MAELTIKDSVCCCCCWGRAGYENVFTKSEMLWKAYWKLSSFFLIGSLAYKQLVRIFLLQFLRIFEASKGVKESNLRRCEAVLSPQSRLWGQAECCASLLWTKQRSQDSNGPWALEREMDSWSQRSFWTPEYGAIPKNRLRTPEPSSVLHWSFHNFCCKRHFCMQKSWKKCLK